VPARNRLGKHEAVIVDRHRLNLIHRQTLRKFFVFRPSNKLPMEPADAEFPTLPALSLGNLDPLFLDFGFISLGPPIGGTYVVPAAACGAVGEICGRRREGAGENERGNGKRRSLSVGIGTFLIEVLLLCHLHWLGKDGRGGSARLLSFCLSTVRISALHLLFPHPPPNSPFRSSTCLLKYL